MKITKLQARRFLLTHQNLRPPRRLRGKEGVMEYIRRVGCIQYDPLDMVGYNPNLVLQSRIEAYRPEYLYELLYSDRRLLDGWDKNMAIYALEDWPYFRRHREGAYGSHKGGYEQIQQAIPQIREAIRRLGPVSSKDLDFGEKVAWFWAPTRISKAALESMYFEGELIIHHKVGTRRFFDFAADHLPPELFRQPDPNLTAEAYFRWHVKRRIGAVGLLWGRPSDAWLGIKGLKSKERTEALTALEAEGEVIAVEVEGVKYQCYIRKEDWPELQGAAEGAAQEEQAAFIAPLDNLLWDRKLIAEIFGFEYIWEVYKPVTERQYGYYVLPVLCGDRFVARFEPRLDRGSKKLEILNWWWEADVTVTDALQQAVIGCFQAFLPYLGAKGIQLKGNSRKNLPWLKGHVEFD